MCGGGQVAAAGEGRVRGGALGALRGEACGVSGLLALAVHRNQPGTSGNAQFDLTDLGSDFFGPGWTWVWAY